MVDTPLPHLDRAFDYVVPTAMSSVAVPGVRVRVRFAGKDVDAFVVERRAASDHVGPLTPLRRVVSPEPVLTPPVLRLARAVADRYAGTLSDVLRLAVPPRHAGAERAGPKPAEPDPAGPDPAGPEPAGPDVRPVAANLPQLSSTPRSAPRPPDAPDGRVSWARYPAGPAFLARLGRGEAPRAVWAALAGSRHWAEAIAEAAAAVLDAGRGAVVVLPDRRDVDVMEQAVLARMGPGRHARLEADLGPPARYRAFLACLRGEVRLAIGTRSAAFAPVADLGLVAVWDDGDDSHAEPRAPYPHSREVLRLRAELDSAAMLVGGWAVSVDAVRWVEQGWARLIEADREVRRSSWARVVTSDDAGGPRPEGSSVSRWGLTPGAWQTIHQGLTLGPVLVQVPRSGYLPAMVCQGCRRPARCPSCAGPVQSAADGTRSCGWCGRGLVQWSCPHCGGGVLRASRVGVQRSAEELGRAFPGARVLVARPDHVPRVGARPAIVMATSGVEPAAENGYAAAVLLDGDLLLSRPDLRAGEEALRRWLSAAALVRPAPSGGVVVVSATASAPAVQALVRLDAAGFARHELTQRAEARLPPALSTVSLVGDPAAVGALLRQATLPDGVEVLGPTLVPRPVTGPRVDVDEGFDLDPDPVRMVLRVPAEALADLAGELHAVLAVRSARKERAVVRVQVDPRDIG